MKVDFVCKIPVMTRAPGTDENEQAPRDKMRDGAFLQNLLKGCSVGGEQHAQRKTENRIQPEPGANGGQEEADQESNHKQSAGGSFAIACSEKGERCPGQNV